MIIYDISQEVFSCNIYPGDDAPAYYRACSMKNGDQYNLTNFSMCAHNGTHIDAPYHFIEDGITVDKIPLDRTVGKCIVIEFSGIINKADIEEFIARSENTENEHIERILIKGAANISANAARTLAAYGIKLIGIEAQSIGEEQSIAETHKILLSENIVILEGICLNGISEGEYFLNATPLSLGGADGAPCRAILIRF